MRSKGSGIGVEANDSFTYEGIEYHGKGTRDDPYVWEENGRTYIDNRTKWLQCKNDWLIVNDVIRALFMGLPSATP